MRNLQCLKIWWLTLAFLCLCVHRASSKGKYTNAEPPPPVMYNKTVFQEDIDYTISPVSATKIPIVVTEVNIGSYSTPISADEAYLISQQSKPTSASILASASSATGNSGNSAAETDSIANSLTSTRRPPMANQNNVQDFINLLAEKIKQNCDYDESSPISKICPSWEKTVMDYSYDSKTRLLNQKMYDRLMGWTFKDIERFIIDNQTAENLKSSCPIGQWCLSGNANETSSGQNYIQKHSKHLCLISSCSSYLNSYYERCVKSSILRGLLRIMPSICESASNISSSYCFEHSLRLIYVGYVTEKSNFNVANMCDLSQSSKCSSECKSMAYDLSKYESCCEDLRVVKSYPAFDWYFDNRKVRDHCDLPLRTFCWKEGKYFIDIDTQMLIMSAVAIMLLTIFILLVIYLICLRSLSKNKISSIDSFGYAQLSQTVFDDELAMESTLYRDEEPSRQQKSSFLTTSRQRESSSFVNQPQTTEIRTLLK